MSIQQTQALSDTIVALATAPGEGALAVVRVSGSQARDVETALTGNSTPRASHQLRRVALRNAAGEPLDDAMAVQMHAPRSFTGEDVLELHLHGSRAVVSGVLAACVAAGARQAGPGEFTLRAFLHGRLDLAQAEAVGDLIAARSTADQTAALRQLRGGLSHEVNGLLAGLERLLSQWQAALDFPEYPTGDGLAPGDPQALRGMLDSLQALRSRVVAQQSAGGRVVLAGPPNAGKSTLLNALVGEERALVDDQAGTTRDPVEVSVPGARGAWSVVDTAGVRESGATALEARGIAMSRRWAQRAEQLCWVMPVGSTDWPAGEGFAHAVVVGSKADLVAEGDRVAWEQQVRQRGHVLLGSVAAAQGRGVAALRATLQQGSVASEGVYAVRARHVELLQSAARALEAGVTALEAGMTLDAVSLDVRQAALALGHMVGRGVDAAILDEIFAQFCIGK